MNAFHAREEAYWRDSALKAGLATERTQEATQTLEYRPSCETFLKTWDSVNELATAISVVWTNMDPSDKSTGHWWIHFDHGEHGIETMQTAIDAMMRILKEEDSQGGWRAVQRLCNGTADAGTELCNVLPSLEDWWDHAITKELRAVATSMGQIQGNMVPDGDVTKVVSDFEELLTRTGELKSAWVEEGKQPRESDEGFTADRMNEEYASGSESYFNERTFTPDYDPAV